MFFTKGRGIGGRIKQRIEDFKVEEIPKKEYSLHNKVEGVEDGKHTVFWMEKFNWDTAGALIILAKRISVSINSFSYAGTKDKRAVTKQRVSILGNFQEKLKSVKIRDIKLYDFQMGNKLSLGDLEGNQFEITIRGVDLEENEIKNRLDLIFIELKNGIPNIFGSQRFGETRPITHIVGKEMIRGDLENAMKIYLCKVFVEEHEESKKARIFLDKNWNRKGFIKASKMFPKNLKYERIVLSHLKDNPRDFEGGFNKLPPKLKKLFPNAVQSWIFNRTVKKIKPLPKEIPIVGYDTNLGKDNLSGLIRKILKDENIKISDFNLKAFRSMKCSGGRRRAKLVPKDLKLLSIEDDEFNGGKKKVKLSFSLPSGSYATVVLREIMKC